MWTKTAGALLFLLIHLPIDGSLATSTDDYDHRGCQYKSLLEQRLENHPHHFRSFNAWPLMDHRSQISRLIQDNFDLPTNQGLVLQNALKPYARMLCNTIDTNCQQGTTSNERTDTSLNQVSEEDSNFNHNSRYNKPFNLREVQEIWGKWQTDLDDFFGVESQQEIENHALQNENDRLQEQEKIYEEQLQIEKELEKELENKRSVRRLLEDRIERQREGMRMQRKGEEERKRYEEQRQAILEQRRMQLEENLRYEQENIVLQQQQEKERLRRVQDERLQQKAARYNVPGSSQSKRNVVKNRRVQDAIHKTVSPHAERHQSKSYGQQKSIRNIYSKNIPSGYGPNDVLIKKDGSNVSIFGKRICSCDENCFTREFERQFVLPQDVVAHTLKASLNHHGTLSVTGNYNEGMSPDDGSRSVTVPVHGIGYDEYSPEDFKEKIECLRKKSGIKLNKIDKRTGKTFDINDYKDIDIEYGGKSNTEYDDDGVTIEVVE